MSARALAAMEEHADQSKLVTLLEDEEPDVRSAAADSLARLSAQHADAPTASAIATLLAESEDEEVRALAAVTLGRLDAANSVGAFTSALEDDAGCVRSAAAAALGALKECVGNTDVADAIASLLEDSEPDVRAASCTALASLRASVHADTIAEMIGDRNKSVREAAAAATTTI